MANEKVAAVIIEPAVTPGMLNANVSGPTRKWIMRRAFKTQS